VEVECTTIDAVSEATGRFPALLKIDVEGAEQAVIAGAVETLRLHRPIVFMEILPDNYPGIAAIVLPLGYSLYNAATLQPADAQSFNVLAIDPARHPAVFGDVFSRYLQRA
jgi:hypothetical protein